MSRPCLKRLDLPRVLVWGCNLVRTSIKSWTSWLGDCQWCTTNFVKSLYSVGLVSIVLGESSKFELYRQKIQDWNLTDTCGKLSNLEVQWQNNPSLEVHLQKIQDLKLTGLKSKTWSSLARYLGLELHRQEIQDIPNSCQKICIEITQKLIKSEFNNLKSSYNQYCTIRKAQKKIEETEKFRQSVL